MSSAKTWRPQKVMSLRTTLSSSRTLPGQWVGAEGGHRLGRDFGLGAGLLAEVLDERGDVLDPLPQRRHPQHLAEPVKKVLPESAFGDRLLQVASPDSSRSAAPSLPPSVH